MMTIRKANPATDATEIWKILEQIITNGDVFAYPPTWTQQKLLSYWFAPEKHVYVAELEGAVVGTFFLQDNQPGLGSHIANASYAADLRQARRGIGRAMGLFSLTEAKRLGYRAMQFNLVLKSNQKAVALWQSIGFQIIGEIPDAFQKSPNSFVNAYVMYQKL
jgi:ribosomal protein S18 acetylase RimI-like enzyme